MRRVDGLSYIRPVDEVTRIDFEELDEQWHVTVVTADRAYRTGEPFPADGGEGRSRLDQVLDRVREMGYQPTRTPYDKVNATRIMIEVAPA